MRNTSAIILTLATIGIPITVFVLVIVWTCRMFLEKHDAYNIVLPFMAGSLICLIVHVWGLSGQVMVEPGGDFERFCWALWVVGGLLIIGSLTAFLTTALKVLQPLQTALAERNKSQAEH